MYECYRSGVVTGRDSFPWYWIVGENLMYLSIWGIAAYLLWPAWTIGSVSITGIAWIVVVLILQILLKKHICSGCYYYGKWCHLGWGKLSSAMFEQDSGNVELGMKLAIFYIVTPPLILISSIAIGIFKDQSILYWILLGVFVLLNAISFPVRKSSCSACTMRNVCAGSAAKKTNK